MGYDWSQYRMPESDTDNVCRRVGVMLKEAASRTKRKPYHHKKPTKSTRFKEAQQ